MPDQSDYGSSTDEAQLVPGALRVYRHFYINVHSGSSDQGRLLSMNQGIPFGEDRIHEAKCVKLTNMFGIGGKPGHATPAPQVDCRCGFYASYDPYGDFYSTQQWTVARVGGERGPMTYNYVDINDFTRTYKATPAPEEPRYHGMITVRAVVEMSGTVVMGTLGVRAQKMKVVAVAPDWPKFLDQSKQFEFDFNRPWDTGRFDDAVVAWNDTRKVPDPELRYAINDFVKDAARYHGFQPWDNVDEMLAEYPAPDLEALGITAGKPPPPIRADSIYINGVPLAGAVSSISVQFKSNGPNYAKLDAAIMQLTAMSRSASAGLKAFGSAWASLPDSFRTDLAPKGATHGPMTAFEAAIERKKNRPAPPGTGIDRRK